MSRLFNENDVAENTLTDARIAVLGYGSQGRAHALNLRDSGLHVELGLRREGRSWGQALEDGWQPVSVPEAVKTAHVVVVLVPDMVQPELFRDEV